MADDLHTPPTEMGGGAAAPPPAGPAAPAVHWTRTPEKLHELGYAQELDRRMSGFSNFAISFTIISILSGCLTVYEFGLLHGGPPVMNWGWLFVGAIVIFVGLSMGEICSAYPTAGGLYYWAAKLAPGNSAPVWSWFTGWFNLLGQVAVTAGISFGCAYSVSAFLAEWTSKAYWLSPGHTIGLLAVILFVQGLLNTYSIRLVALLNDVSVWWHLIGVAVIVIILYWAPSSHAHQSVSFMFGKRGVGRVQGPLGVRGAALRHRPGHAERAVHLHGLRRLGPRLRGDARGEHAGGQGHRPVDLGLADRRLHPARRGELRDPALRAPCHLRRDPHQELFRPQLECSSRGRSPSSSPPAGLSRC